VLGGSEEGGNTAESLVATKNERKRLSPMAQKLVLYEDSLAENLPPNEEKNVVYHDPKILLKLALLVKIIA
jgi:hypothetical protein